MGSFPCEGNVPIQVMFLIVSKVTDSSLTFQKTLKFKGTWSLQKENIVCLRSREVWTLYEWYELTPSWLSIHRSYSTGEWAKRNIRWPSLTPIKPGCHPLSSSNIILKSDMLIGCTAHRFTLIKQDKIHEFDKQMLQRLFKEDTIYLECLSQVGILPPPQKIQNEQLYKYLTV